MTPLLPITISTVAMVLDLLGTFAFALSGAVSGVKHRLDIFGVLVLSFAAANAGGITRDLLIGAVPPPGVADWRYIVAALAAGLLTFYGGALVERLWNSVLLFDAMGLGLFAVTGASKALAYHLPPLTAVLLGVLTGIGGGMVRDILVSEVPAVLRADLYAVAALAGAAVVVIGRALGFATDVVSILGAAVCIGLRIMAMRHHWQLPWRVRTARQSRKTTPSARQRIPRTEWLHSRLDTRSPIAKQSARTRSGVLALLSYCSSGQGRN